MRYGASSLPGAALATYLSPTMRSTCTRLSAQYLLTVGSAKMNIPSPALNCTNLHVTYLPSVSDAKTSSLDPNMISMFLSANKSSNAGSAVETNFQLSFTVTR